MTIILLKKELLLSKQSSATGRGESVLKYDSNENSKQLIGREDKFVHGGASSCRL